MIGEGNDRQRAALAMQHFAGINPTFFVGADHSPFSSARAERSGTIKVEVHLTKPDLEIIKPEMSIKVSFLEAPQTGTETQGVTVPKSAIRTEGNESYVWTVHDGTVRRVGISIGRETETGVEVSQGLKGGDMVVTTPQVNLSDGTKVSIGGERE